MLPQQWQLWLLLLLLLLPPALLRMSPVVPLMIPYAAGDCAALGLQLGNTSAAPFQSASKRITLCSTGPLQICQAMC
jgi:hypothetical protein